jgi:hypothetical protein
MPTAKPRITITLTDQQHAILSSLSTLQKVSMSSIVVDLLDTTLPVLERLTSILQNAANAPQSVLDELRRTAISAENEVSGMAPHVLGLLEEMEGLSSEAGGGATGRPRHGATRSGAEEGPPTSNRGVRITVPASKIAHISPMKKGEKHGRSQK